MQTLSSRGSDLIKSFESMRLKAYLDGGGVPTAGWGHTGHEVVCGKQYTLETVNEWFATDSQKAAKVVVNNTDLPLTQNQFDALVSLCFNIGAGAFVRSTLLQLVNAGKLVEASCEFLRWDHDNGVEVAGLKARRERERELFDEPTAVAG